MSCRNSLAAVLIIILAGFLTQGFSQALTLEDVIREVCTKSDSAKMMKETIIKSKETVRQNWSAALPSFSASASGTELYGPGVGLETGQTSFSIPFDPAKIDSDVTYKGLFNTLSGLSDLTAPSSATLYKAGLQASQVIYTFGKVGTAIHVADEFDKSVRSSTDRSMQQLQLAAVDAFYSVVISEIKLDIAQRSFARKKELYEFLSRNFNLGSGNKAQLLNAKSEMKSQVSDVTTAGEELLSARMSLNMFMGHPLDDHFDLDTAVVLNTLMTKALPSEKDAVRAALDQREDLQSLKFLAEATKGGARIYDAMYLPTIAATGAIGTQASTPEDLTNWDNKTWSVGVGLQWNIFDGFENSAKAQQYRSDAHKLEIARDEISKAVEIEVATDVSECNGADTNVTAAADALAAAQESYDLTNSNFRQGSGQFSDLQLAEEQLRQAELGNIAARYRQVRSRAALQVAMGNYIVTLGEKP